ncbi:hypothetical protein ACQEU3_42175 [Spirillospora sp. CA-253888]
MDEELEFMPIDTMRRETAALARLAEDDELAQIFWLARGGVQAEPVRLPWLDPGAAVVIAMSRYSDSVGIALDHRTGAEDPRVVAFGEEMIDFHQAVRWALGWRVVTPTFSEFAAALNLAAPTD